MREIKFRKWNTDKLCMTWPHKIRNPASTGPRTSLAGGERILQQYTGLKDKNGKEIYEGDIVEGDYHVNDSTIGRVSGVVEYNSMAFGFVGTKSDGSRWFDTITTPGYTEVNDIEVIGNIYENPELLKSAGTVSSPK